MPLRDVAGHDNLRTLLSSAAARGSLPQSLIFAGPAGVGKFRTAVAVAQLLNCEQPADGDACGSCKQCTRIARRVHADVIYIEPGESGSIRIEQIRKAIESSGYRPFEGRRRVVIINDAEAIVSPAQDALLKILEEPPNATAFILVTSSPELLLPTIRSRCQRLRFGRLAPADVADVLVVAHGYAEADAHAAASLSDGSIGRALEEGSEAFVDARAAALQLLEVVAPSPPPARRIQGASNLPGAGRSKADRDGLAQSLRAMSSLLRDLGVLDAQGEPRALANRDLRRSLDALLPRYDHDRILRAFAAVDRALNALDRNASPKIVADWLAFQI